MTLLLLNYNVKVHVLRAGDLKLQNEIFVFVFVFAKMMLQMGHAGFCYCIWRCLEFVRCNTRHSDPKFYHRTSNQIGFDVIDEPP